MRQAMEAKHRVYFSVFAGCAAFACGLLLTGLVTMPVLWYFPIAREWRLTTHPGALAVDWYGRSLVACVASQFGTVAAWVTTGLLPTPKTDRLFRWLALWTALLFLATGALYVLQLSRRVAPAEPIPAGYQPR